MFLFFQLTDRFEFDYTPFRPFRPFRRLNLKQFALPDGTKSLTLRLIMTRILGALVALFALTATASAGNSVTIVHCTPGTGKINADGTYTLDPGWTISGSGILKAKLVGTTQETTVQITPVPDPMNASRGTWSGTLILGKGTYQVIMTFNLVQMQPPPLPPNTATINDTKTNQVVK